MTEEENIPNPEHVAGQVVKFYQDALDNFAATFEEDDSDEIRGVANDVAEAREALEKTLGDQKIASVEMTRRRVRPQDNVIEGEHPGVTMKINYESGMTAFVNIHGGLGREVVTRDIRDSDVAGRSSHTRITQAILDKPTNIGFHVYDPTGEDKLFDSWMIYNRNKRITLTSCSYTKPESWSQVNIEGQLTINENSPRDDGGIQKYAFGQISSKLEGLKKDLASLTPPEK